MERLVGPSPSGTPAPGSSRTTGFLALPDDLLQEASRRLGIWSLLGFILWITATILNYFAVEAMQGAPKGFQPSDYIAVGGAGISLALFLYTRRSRRPPQFMLELGLWYLGVTAAMIGFMWHGDPGLEMAKIPIFPMFTWIGPLVLMFAAIIPTPPFKMLGASLIAVSMGPAGMLWARHKGLWDFEGLGPVIIMHYPDYILALVSVVVAHVVTRLGQQVSKAREMGSYHVGELIGRGGMGEVYYATHRMLARPAAIKLIRPDMLAGRAGDGSELALKRFRREAEVAANLRSPHTVALYDFGLTEDQSLYFVMELLTGMDLDRMVRSHGPLPPARVIHVLQQVCASLAEAHAQGLVHRDIKPANIHVGTQGLEHDFVKVLDFGLVKSVDVKERGELTAQTAEGITPGTPDYMAPEMTLGGAIDARTDLYAVGCVAYFMLTGKPVFEAANVFHMIARHLNDEPVPLERTAPQPVPKELERLVLGCLRKKPEERPGSALELAGALTAVPVPHWTEEQAAAWWAAVAPVPDSVPSGISR